MAGKFRAVVWNTIQCHHKGFQKKSESAKNQINKKPHKNNQTKNQPSKTKQTTHQTKPFLLITIMDQGKISTR